MTSKKNLSAAFLAAAIMFYGVDVSFAAVTNIINCGTNGNTIVPNSPAVGGSFTSGQMVTFSGVVKQNVTAAGYTSYWSNGVMEFYLMDDAKVPLIDACNDENYNQESCLMFSCSMAGDVPTMSPSVPCPLKWPGCKWTPCNSCASRVLNWCGSEKLPYCDEVDTVRTDGDTKIYELGSYSPSNASNVTSFNYNYTAWIPNVSLSGNARFVVYYRGIYQRKDPFGRFIILGGGTKTSAYVWQAAYDTITYVPCTCNAWTAGSCGVGGCTALKRQQTRTCNPAGCDTTSRCVNDATCCSCGAWSNSTCGGGTCASRQRYQTRTCNPAGCQAAAQCVADNSCINLSASLNASPSSGNAPLTSTLTATALGNAQGNLNYYFWWNCNDACSTLAACQAACGAANHQSLGNASATYSTTATYTGSAAPKVIIERESKSAEARSSVSACSCGSWGAAATCATGGCSPLQRQQTRTCNPAGCQTESQCVADATCCACGSWGAAATCGTGGCGVLQRQQTRTCNPGGCQTESQCVADATCCTCGAWANDDCGLGGCPANQMRQTRTCNPGGCQTESQCVASPSCPKTLGVTFVANPDSGNAPLNTTITATVTGNVAGSINYTVWYDCNSACTTVVGCVAACGVWNAKDDGSNDTVKSYIHTYATDGVYAPRIVVERGSLVALGSDAVTVSAAPTLSVNLAAAPNSGSAPLATVLTATVSGSATGSINYTTWFNCNDACATVAACVAACGAWDDKADGVAATAKTVNHTYGAVGTYTPKIIVERSSLAANDDTTVTVGAAPTLSIGLTAAPNSGNDPLDVVLTGTVSGSATGSINYTTWFNCNDACATVAACVAACGAWDDKADGVAATAKTVNHTYGAVGTYTPKMIVERESIMAGDSDTVTVTSGGGPSTLSVDVTATPDSGSAPLDVTLTGTVSGTATGTINYTTWWDCDDPCATVADCAAACGAWDDKEDGSNSTTKTLSHTYAAAGIYTPKMIVERDSLTASESVTVNVIIGNDPPTADTLTKQNDFCASGLATMFSWNYSDPENDPQAYRQVQVDDDTDFSSPADDSGKVATASDSYVTLASKLQYDTTYYWRLKVWDDKGNESDWIDGSDFTMPLHSYPEVAFSLSPATPKVDDIITYTDNTQVFGGATISSRSWIIEAATPNTSVAGVVEVVYAVKGNYTTKLTITDSNGYTCALEKPIKVKGRIPDWDEI